MEHLRRWVAQSLERGHFSGGACARTLELAWQTWSARRLARPLSVPENVVTIAVGGATLGGSGKTPLSIACARFAAAAEHCIGHGAPVALIGHAYRATPRSPRVVGPNDDLDVVGDEALVCARALLEIPRVEVIVAPTRQRAIAFAVSRGARVLILDGVAQTAPIRANLALLALDGRAPWGTGACPPRGDLKAPVAALLSACDRIVSLDGLVRSRGATVIDTSRVHAPRVSRVRAPRVHHPMNDALRLEPLIEREPILDYEALRQMRLGLFTALARPERIVDFLHARGVSPRTMMHTSDHGPLEPKRLADAAKEHRLDAWVATHKCAIHLRSSSLPVLVLEHVVELPPSLRQAVGAALGDRRAADPASSKIQGNVARP